MPRKKPGKHKTTARPARSLTVPGEKTIKETKRTVPVAPGRRGKSALPLTSPAVDRRKQFVEGERGVGR